MNVYHCGTVTVTAARKNSGVLVADGSTHFLFLKQTQKAAEGPGPVCRMC